MILSKSFSHLCLGLHNCKWDIWARLMAPELNVAKEITLSTSKTGFQTSSPKILSHYIEVVNAYLMNNCPEPPGTTGRSGDRDIRGPWAFSAPVCSFLPGSCLLTLDCITTFVQTCALTSLGLSCSCTTPDTSFHFYNPFSRCKGEKWTTFNVNVSSEASYNFVTIGDTWDRAGERRQ